MSKLIHSTNAGTVKVDTTQLDTLMKEATSYPNARARVGVLGPKSNRADAGTAHNFKGLNNAEIGLRNEFGVMSLRIPERSFLRMPLITRLPKTLEKVARKDWIKELLASGKLGLLKKLGAAGEAAIFDAFATKGFGKWKPNAPLTVMLKGSARPLIDHGELRQSIASEVVTK